jgi:hypothetical protein
MIYYILSNNKGNQTEGLIENTNKIKDYLLDRLKDNNWDGKFRAALFYDATDYLPFDILEIENA